MWPLANICRVLSTVSVSRATRRLVGDYALAALRQDYSHRGRPSKVLALADEVIEQWCGLLRCICCAAYMSLPGTFLPCQPRRAMSVTGGRPADICSMRVHRILTHIGPRGAAGEPHGHPSIGDLDALTDCAALTIANCPSKKPTAAIFWIPHSGARVAGKLQSAESATGQLAYAALRSRAGRVVAAVRRSTRSGSVVGRG